MATKHDVRRGGKGARARPPKKAEDAEDGAPAEPRPPPARVELSEPAAPPKRSDLSEWFEDQYRKAVGLDREEGGARFKRLAAAFPARASDPYAPFPATGRQRMGNFLRLRLGYPLGAEGYACLAMAASCGRASAHYAYAYWRRGREGADPEYVCVSPTFDSRDGEYRRRFIGYPVFAQACADLAAAFAPYEEAILRLAAEGLLTLRATAYPEDAAAAVADRAGELRLPVVAFAAALLLDLWEVRNGMLMAHTGNAYVALMTAVAAAAPALERLGPGVRTDLSRFSRGSADQLTVQCGQKLVPMSNREAMQASDFNLAAWRELAVTRLAGDLVLNYVSPAFALYNQWTYVEGADEGLFENRAMEDRYVRSRAVEAAAHSLREARRALALGPPGPARGAGEAAGPAAPNYYTEELSAQVYESLEYAQSFLLMSPVALAHTMEDVGWSLRSVAAYVRRAPHQWPAAVGAFADPDAAARYLFDVAYAAHCLHSRLGVAHTDLHGNNMTFYLWGAAHRPRVTAGASPGAASTAAFEPFYDAPVVAYVAGPRGEADAYVFPAAGASGCLIDYSRCVLGPGFRARLEEGRSPLYATLFYRDQVNRVVRTLHRYAPAAVEKHEAAVKAAVLANFEAVFPVLCAVDFLAIGRNVAAALVDAEATVDPHEVRPFRVARAAIELAARLESAAQELLVSGILALAEGARGSRGPSAPPAFPGESLLPSVFAEWAFPRWAQREGHRLSRMQLVDAYRFNNELRYSGEDYSKFPPWARLDEIERHLGEYKLTDLFERGPEPFLEALRSGARVEIIAERVRAEQEKLDGTPVSTASSWLDE